MDIVQEIDTELPSACKLGSNKMMMLCWPVRARPQRAQRAIILKRQLITRPAASPELANTAQPAGSCHVLPTTDGDFSTHPTTAYARTSWFDKGVAKYPGAEFTISFFSLQSGPDQL